MEIRYADGRVQDGMMLALKGCVARIAFKDADDVAEFRLVNDQWISEDCEPVLFEFPLEIFRAIGIIGPEAKPEPRKVRKFAH